MPIRVLYIDDEKSFCELFKVSVEAHGYAVDFATTGEDGLAMHARQPYDLVATDYPLSGMTGIDVIRKLFIDNPFIPIVMVTGRGNEHVAAEALTLGAYNYVIKDSEEVFLELLPNIIESALKRGAERNARIAAEQELKQVQAELEGRVNERTQELQASEACLDYAQLLARLGSWTLDFETGETLWTDEQYRLFGYEPGEIKPSLEFVIEALHPDDRSRFLDTVEEVSNSDTHSYEHEYRIICPDETERYLHSVVEVERDGDGSVSFMRGFYQDITERKLAEAESQRSQDQLATTAELIKLGYWEWDDIRDCAISYTEGLIEILDVDANVFTEGNREHEHIHPEDLERYRFVTTFSGGKEDHFDLEYRSIRRDGESTFCREIGTAIRDGTGAIVRSFGIVQDITESKRAEQTLERALIKAEEGSRSKSEFLAHISHELRTPLNAITGFSQMMTLKTFGELGHPKYAEYAEDVLRSGQHLIALINDILDLSKVEAGEITLNRTNFSIHHAIVDCVNVIGAQRLSDPKRITTEIAKEITDLHADNRMFRQVLLNLLSNAVKFTPISGRIIITAEFDENRSMLIRVIDTGMGISSEDMPKVLEPFGQARANTRVSHQGTGLGLPLSQKLMELHGGTLELESELGVGTTVTMMFPTHRTMKANK